MNPTTLTTRMLASCVWKRQPMTDTSEEMAVVVQTVFDVIADALTDNMPVCIKDFGTFYPKHKKKMIVQSGICKTKVEVDNVVMAKFRVGKELRERMKQKFKRTVREIKE